MKKEDILNEVKGDQYLITGSEFWEIRCETLAQEHGMAHTIRLFKVLPGGEFEELPIRKMVDKIIETLVDRVDVRAVLKEALLSNNPMGEVVKVYNILEKHPEVVKPETPSAPAKKTLKPRLGCLYLEIENPDPGAENAQIYIFGP